MIAASFAVALPVMLASGRLLDRLGAAWGIGAPALLMASGLALVATLPPIPLLVVGVILITAGSGAYDVGIHGVAMGDARWSRSTRLTLLHASFSAGGVGGALTAGSLIGAGVPFTIVYLLLVGALVLAATVAARGHWAVAASMGAVPRGIALSILPLAALAAVGFVASGSLETWSAIYLRDQLGAGAFVGALGPAAFHVAMLTGRLAGAAVAGWLGPRDTLGVAGVATSAGMSVALLATVPTLAIPGMAVRVRRVPGGSDCGRVAQRARRAAGRSAGDPDRRCRNRARLPPAGQPARTLRVTHGPSTHRPDTSA